MSVQIKKAMVLAAGEGRRMRPLTDDRPKPLVEVGGRALIDHVIDRLEVAGVEEVVVNLHYMADMLEAHLKGRKSPRIIFSDERDALLDTGGGVKRALPLLGDDPFLVMSADTGWVESPDGKDNLKAMMDAFDPDRCDCMLLVADCKTSVGFVGRGDFDMDEERKLTRRAPDGDADYMYASVQVMKPSLFDATPQGAFSNNWIWDQLNLKGRLLGYKLEGRWLHASSAADVAAIDEVLRDAP